MVSNMYDFHEESNRELIELLKGWLKILKWEVLARPFVPARKEINEIGSPPICNIWILFLVLRR